MSTHVTAGELFERHVMEVYRYFRRMTRRADLAEDLTQETFLRVLRGLHRYKPMDRETQWIFTIARHVLLDHVRSADEHIVSAAEVGEPTVDATHVTAISFHEALALVPRAEREMYLLREHGGLTYAEIARVCQTTEDAVRSKLLRARRAIKQVLARRVFADSPTTT
jgi:RNA polymerase sigma-70 factor (ECF subfamily)